MKGWKLFRLTLLFLVCSATLLLLLAKPDRGLFDIRVNGSAASYLLNIELWACAFLFAFALTKTAARQRFKFMLLMLLFFLFALSATFSDGRILLSPSLCDPGSLISQQLLLFSSPMFERAIEPSVILLVYLLLSVELKGGRICLWGAVITLACSLSLELCWLMRINELPFLWSVAHFFLYQIFFALLVSGVKRSLESEASPVKYAGPSTLIIFSALLLSGVFFSKAPIQVSTYYYSWFPENWVGGYSAQLGDVVPEVGEYSSSDKAVFKQHLQWAKEAGITSFIFDWWPKRPDIRRRIESFLSDEEDLLDNFKFAVHYESLDLGRPKERRLRGETKNIIVVDEEIEQQLVKHFEHIARYYMKHPSYLKVRGRPVLFVYASRHLVGKLDRAIHKARQRVLQTEGLELYLVADEAFYQVVDDDIGEVYLRAELSPAWQRLTEFDAITSYNPYDPTRNQAKPEVLLREAKEMYGFYSKVAATLGMDFIPAAIPGYDDRALRPDAGHAVVPRELEVGDPFFPEALKQLVRPYLSETLPFFAVTSWNEWNEGTHIEPARLKEDGRSSKGAIRSGSIAPYGRQHLDELKKFLLAE